MRKCWDDEAWQQYINWQKDKSNKYAVKRIHTLIEDIDRNGNKGIGKPEPLKHQYKGFWSRRISDEHRLVYKISVENKEIRIRLCEGHYE